MSSSGRGADALLLLGLAAIWGASYLFIKIAVAELQPFTLVSVRLGLGAAGLLLIARLRGFPHLGAPTGTVPGWVKRQPFWLRAAVQGLLGAIIPWTLIAWGEIHIASGAAAIVNVTAPFFSTIIGHFVGLWGHEERLTADRVAGLLLATAGVVVLVAGSEGVQSGSSEGLLELLGYLAILGSSVAYGVGALYSRLAFAGAPPLVPAIAQNSGGAAVALPLLVVLGLPGALPSPPVLGSVLVLSLVGTSVAYILYYALVQRIGATGGLSVTYLIPVFALAYGALLLGEPITPAIVIGFGLILAGVALTTGSVRLLRRGLE